MTRAARALVAALIAGAALIAPLGSARAAEGDASAAFNGLAQASAAFIPVAINPNVDLWPVYSMSEIDSSLSHGISGGFWPGFLVDASFFQFGHQPAERAMFGVAESLWPTSPTEDEAASSDFARLCEGGAQSQVRGPAGTGDRGFPEPMMTGCRSMYTQYRGYVPWKAGGGRSESLAGRASGEATGVSISFGPLRAANATSTSATRLVDGKQVVSESAVQMTDVTIGDQLRIRSIRSRATATADARGGKASHELTIEGATYLGESVEIGPDGVASPTLGDLDDDLARQGLEVRLVQGDATESDTVAGARSGGLVVRLTRPAMTHDQKQAAESACARSDAAQPDGSQQVDQDLGANPFYEAAFPYDQTPQQLGVHESVPPSAPCVLLLFERSVDAGVSIAGSVAASRFQAIPGVPTFTDGGGSGGSTSGSLPPFAGGSPIGGIGSPGMPSYGIPPVPVDTIGPPLALNGLGEEVAATVRTAYGAFVLLLVFLLVARRAFRASVRS